MNKKVLLAGLMISLSAQAGRELQLVVNTPVAEGLRWLSSGTTGANIAAGVVVASVGYSAFSLLRAPFGRKVQVNQALLDRVDSCEALIAHLQAAPRDQEESRVDGSEHQRGEAVEVLRDPIFGSRLDDLEKAFKTFDRTAKKEKEDNRSFFTQKLNVLSENDARLEGRLKAQTELQAGQIKALVTRVALLEKASNPDQATSAE